MYYIYIMSDNFDEVLNETENVNQDNTILETDINNNDDDSVQKQKDDSDDENLDINADTETMNKQINKKSKNKEQAKVVYKIDKNTLKTLIIEWLSLDDQIKKYKEAIKDMGEEKKQFEAQILELMNLLEQDTIITDKGNISRNIRVSKGSLTPELIKTTLTDILKCSETADIYTNQIVEKRQSKENISLKRENFEKKKTKKPLMR